ncbi:MAG: ADP-ribosylglycohydrolase family protein [Pirellulales bacterium]|nr:ADP-ribosylglycohydrolase family protein [Pirellulales bacterium]
MADGLGAPWEGLPADLIFVKGPAEKIVQHASGEVLQYTDDTQMAIGVAEALIKAGRIDQDVLIQAFVANYEPDRGYGQGARRLLSAVAEGGDWRELVQSILPGGSFGNGGAMRVAPVGLFFHNDLDRVAHEAALSAEVTHAHPLGIDGARLLALAVALAIRQSEFEASMFFSELHARAETEEFQWQLATIQKLDPLDAIGMFGNSLEAHRSVVTAIACFAASPRDYSTAIRYAIGQGDDVDTLAAMAGAISGAHLGIGQIPSRLVVALENDEKGRDYLGQLASQLHERFQELA